MIYLVAYYLTGFVLFAHIIYKSGTITFEDLFAMIFAPIVWPVIVPIYWITKYGHKVLWRIK